ncbi:MAG: RyR domain-containing protein [Gemmatales bacterium]
MLKLDTIFWVGRQFMSIGWVLGLALIVGTIVLGSIGFKAEVFENQEQTPHSWSDALYKAASLLAIQTGSVPVKRNWILDLARWLGMLFFASALITFAIRLSRDSIHRMLVKCFARNHIIVAGLGQHGVRLVEKLRQEGKTVVVIEGNRTHSSADRCRRCGAIVLWGEPTSAKMLETARLDIATELLALFANERECVGIATVAYDLLHEQKRSREKVPVTCVLQITEPGLLDVVRSHKIKTDPTDRYQLEIFNSHEIAASTMVREARTQCQTGQFQKLMVCSLGSYHRLGEMVVLRAIKDHMVLAAPDAGKLHIDVFDKDAEHWLKNFRSRYKFTDEFCTIATHHCWARKVGSHEMPADYDAAFICIGDDGAATAQAVTLRRQRLSNKQPIMVAVQQSALGFGKWLDFEASGWGDNIHAIGMDDSLYDPEMALQPELEMRAQAIHTNYRIKMKKDLAQAATEAERKSIQQQHANQPWKKLSPEIRMDNRENANRYDDYLWETNAFKTKRYRRVFAPDWMLNLESRKLLEFADAEVDSLAAREHERWLNRKLQEGWTYAPDRNDDRKQSPYVRPFDELTDEQKIHNREFIRSIPRVLALADYRIEQA